MAKRLLCVVISLLMVMSVLPVGVVADEPTGNALTSAGGTLSAGDYYLSDDVTLSSNITIASGSTVTIDLYGHTLTGTGTGSVISVYGTLTITDTSTEADGKVTGGSNNYGGGVYVYSGGSLTLTGGNISGNSATLRGGGVYVTSGSLTINGGSISNNTVSSSSSTIGGGGVYVSQGTLIMTGGSISSNAVTNIAASGTGTSATGGGVYITGSGSTFTMSGGSISCNTCTDPIGFVGGGGVRIAGNKEVIVTMSGGSISNNTISGYKAWGGGVCLYSTYSGGSKFTLSGGEISGNTADGSYTASCIGGGVSVMYYDIFTITGGTISGNSAAYGGGVGLLFGTVNLNGGTITENTASVAGGGIIYCSDGYATTTITASGSPVVTGNTVDGEANNLYINASKYITLTGALAEGANIGITLASADTDTQFTTAEDGTTYYSSSLSYFSYDSGEYTISIDDSGYLVITSATVVPTFYGKNIVLAGEIGVKFYVNFTDVENPEDYSVKFTVDGKDAGTVEFNAEENFGAYTTDGIYYFQCDVACWEMGSTIVATIVNSEGTVEVSSGDYSVSTYASNRIDKSTNDDFVSLLNAMLNFGYYTEQYYNSTHSTALTVSVGSEWILTDDMSGVTELGTYAATLSESNTLEVKAGLVLDTIVELRFYVPTSESTTYTVKIDGTVVQSSGTYTSDGVTYNYYTTDANTLVQNWDYGHSIEVTDSEGTVVYSATGYSVMSYANTVLTESAYSSYTDLQNLVKAMYLYNQAANTYLGLN